MTLASRVNQVVVAAAKNGSALACDLDATKFILAHPRGAYTSARTVEKKRVFDYEGHLKRLVESMLMIQQAQETSNFVHVLEDHIRSRTGDTLRAAMEDFKTRFGVMVEEEYKLTVLVCTESNDGNSSTEPDVYCHIGLLPPLRGSLVKLQIAGHPRSNARAKDSAWVHERRAIYDAMPKDVEETILMDPTTKDLLEGSQTNFFALQDNTIFTAEEGILKGTVRALVLEVAKELGIAVQLTPPKLDQIDQWQACFISSTSRLVLGAGVVQFMDPATNTPKQKAFERHELMDRLADGVKCSVLRKSSQVFV